MSPRKKAKDEGLVEVVLLKPHIHAGREYGAGERVRIRPDQAERLKARGIADVTTANRGGEPS